jgi:hypothetical protein
MTIVRPTRGWTVVCVGAYSAAAEQHTSEDIEVSRTVSGTETRSIGNKCDVCIQTTLFVSFLEEIGVEPIPVVVVTEAGNPQGALALLTLTLLEVSDDGAVFARPAYAQITDLNYKVDVLSYAILVNTSKFLDTAMKISDYKES